MSDSPKRKRSILMAPLTVLLVLVALVGLAAMRLNNFFRRRVPVEDLKYPVLVLQPIDLLPFAEWEPHRLKWFTDKSDRSPMNGTIIIDSEFNTYTQVNVKKKESEIGWLARRYLTPGLPARYTFDLIRTRKADPVMAMQTLLARPRFSDDPTENAAMHAAVAKQTTMAGILDAMKIYKPIEPAPTTTTAPTTEPVEMIEPGPATTEEPPRGNPN
jgi:hypothetical protein